MFVFVFVFVFVLGYLKEREGEAKEVNARCFPYEESKREEVRRDE